MSTTVVGLGPPGADAVPALAVRTSDQTPGAMGAKDYQTRRGAGLRPGRSVVFALYGMTLGNGYLGPRIDEERSEMRYVV